jgi:tetratricopeptide (TPR) repeat protein
LRQHTQPPTGLLSKAIKLHKQKEYVQAQKIYEQVLEINPGNFDALRLLGTIFAQTNQLDKSLVLLERAQEINSSHIGLLNNYGNVLKDLKRYEEALLIYQRAINLNPDKPDAWINQATTLFEIKRYPEALVSYQKAIALNPDYAEALLNCGVMQLHNLFFIDGWQGFEARWQKKDFNSKPLITTKPVWKGGEKEGRLLIWAEQGIGDQILYGSMFKELAHFPQKKIVFLNSKLISIFKRSFPEYSFLEGDEIYREDLYDEQIPIGSLGQFFRKELSDFKNIAYPYLIDDPVKTQHIKSLPPFSNQKTCGISWRSSNQKLGKDKSVSLLDLLPILSSNDMQFINLQYGDTAKEVADLAEEHGQSLYSVPEIDIFNDIDGVLSIIKACDLVITTSNSTAHLAGALGKEALLLVPYSVGKFWYWHDIDGFSLWYPSVRVFQQKTQGDWATPIHEMKSYLEKKNG